MTFVVDGVNFTLKKTLYPGEIFFFRAGRSIGVGKNAITWGPHRFEFEVNSRATVARQDPVSIAATEDGLKNEFFENAAAWRPPVPVMVGDSDDDGSLDVRVSPQGIPQVFRTKVSGLVVAWRVHFESHQYVGGVDGGGAHGSLSVYIPTSENPRYHVYHDGFNTSDFIGIDQPWYQRMYNRIVE